MCGVCSGLDARCGAWCFGEGKKGGGERRGDVLGFMVGVGVVSRGGRGDGR